MNKTTRIFLAALAVAIACALGAQEESQPDSPPQTEPQPASSPFADQPAADEQEPPELDPFAGQPAVEGQEPEELDPFADRSIAEEELERTTVVPWSVDVLGREFESFPNDEASQVLTDWLVSSLIDFKVFNVVNRDRVEAVLSAQRPAGGDDAEDASLSALASAGRLLKADYFLFTSWKNLGESTEVDFKLLDVDSATYSHPDDFTIPFNPAIEEMKPEIDRIVWALGAEFPLAARISEILDGGERLLLDAGTEDGLGEALEVEVRPAGGGAPAGGGFITRCDATEAEVELDPGAAELNLFGYVAYVKIAPPAQAALKKGLRDFARGNYRQASAVFQKGLEAEPENGLLHASYARSCWRLGLYERAVEAFRQALVFLGDDVALLEDAAATMLESGHAEELIEILDQGGRRESSHALTLSYGQAQEVLGYRERARDAYESALASDPDSAQAHFRLAVLAVKRGEPEVAERELGRVRELAAIRSRSSSPWRASARHAPRPARREGASGRSSIGRKRKKTSRR